MKTILTFSGWGQKPDSLVQAINTAPDRTTIQYVNYADRANITEVLDDIRGTFCDLAIGWSLGGQILLRALAAGAIHPRHLILLATPFQFHASPEYPEGAPAEMLASIVTRYRQNPQAMLLHFASLIAEGDRNNVRLLPVLEQQIYPKTPHWIYWLEELAAFSCLDLDPSLIPSIHLLHGTEDQVISYAQSQYFLKHFPDTHLHTLSACGHAPHLHDSDHFNHTIRYVLTL